MDWQRSFAGHAMHSQFTLEGDNLVEKLGPLKLCMQLRVEETGKLNYCLQESRLWGMRVPARLSPSLLAYEDELNGRYHFHVRIALPAIGKLIEYGGVLELTPDADN
jgi:hypothetical protein